MKCDVCGGEQKQAIKHSTGEPIYWYCPRCRRKKHQSIRHTHSRGLGRETKRKKLGGSDVATVAEPGSSHKISVLMKRCKAGRDLFQPDDNTWIGDPRDSGVERICNREPRYDSFVRKRS